ncbi:MAG: hypothetical protein AAFQ92_21290 [Bacteroidota bacterium]
MLRFRGVLHYAFLKKDEQTVFFMPYEDFPIIEFSLVDYAAKQVAQLPDDAVLDMPRFWNPKAFTQKGYNWYFITPDHESVCSRIFCMSSHPEIEEIGQYCYSISPKGIQGGKFKVTPILRPLLG